MFKQLRFFYSNNILLPFVCLLLVVASVASVFVYSSVSPVFLLFITLFAVLVAGSEEKTVKTFCYFILGFASYAIVSNSFSTIPGQEWRLLSVIPFLYLGWANATAALIGYADGFVSGGVFTGASIFALLASTGPVAFSSIDRFLVAIVLFVLHSFIFVQFVSHTVETRKTLFAVLKAAVAASILIALLFSLRFFDLGYFDLSVFSNTSDLSQVLSSKLAMIFINAVWLSFVSNVFFAMLLLLAFSILLYSLEYVRDISEEGIIYTFIGKAKAAPPQEASAKEDPYASLIAELKNFERNASKYDKLDATELISRLKQEFNVLSSKYDTKGKQQAAELLKKVQKLSR